jgi:hypothetical protein
VRTFPLELQRNQVLQNNFFMYFQKIEILIILHIELNRIFTFYDDRGPEYNEPFFYGLGTKYTQSWNVLEQLSLA